MNTHKHKSQLSLSIRDMTLSALMAAILCILGPLTLPLPISPVPVSLTNLVLFLLVYILDCRCCLLSYGLYFLLGLAGLPIFSGFSGGLGRLVGPTGGYLIGFFFQLAISCAFFKHGKGKRCFEILGLILGTVLCYAFGTLWLSTHLGIAFPAGLSLGVLPYLPGDGLKIILASIAGPQIRKRLDRIT